MIRKNVQFKCWLYLDRDQVFLEGIGWKGKRYSARLLVKETAAKESPEDTDSDDSVFVNDDVTMSKSRATLPSSERNSYQSSIKKNKNKKNYGYLLVSLKELNLLCIELQAKWEGILYIDLGNGSTVLAMFGCKKR